MRIAHVVPALAPSHGGPPVVAARLAAAQARLGHDVRLVFYDVPAERAEVEQAMRDIPEASSVHLIRLDAPQGGLSGRLSALLSSSSLAPITDAIADVDLAHLHGVWESIIRTAAGAARRLDKPYVVAPHGMLDPWSLGQKALKKKIALALGYRAMLDGAAFLHVLNVDERALLEPLRLHCPTELIPNGIFLSEIDQHAAPPPTQDPPFILFLSRLHYKKGLDHLADAFAIVRRQAPEWQLVVAGPDGGERQPFVERIARHGLDGAVKLVGPVYGADKFALLRRAGCFCLPSRQEGFSIAILEAMACGVPVVVSENCHFPEVAEAGAGRVVPLDPQAIAAALLALTDDADHRRRMGDAGRQLVEARYTWDKVAGQSVAAYERAMASSRRRA